MILYEAFVLSYTVFSIYCYYIDVISEKSIENRNLNLEKYDRAIQLVIFNVFVVSYLFFYLSNTIYNPRDFNSILSIRDLCICNYMSQLLFYLIHRIFHKVPFLLKYHKVHHEFKEPLGIRAAYTHPIDFVFGNLIPLGITPFLLDTDIYTTCAITMYSVYATIIIEHSNHNHNNIHHIRHHKYYNYNFGSAWIDKMMGTYK